MGTGIKAGNSARVRAKLEAGTTAGSPDPHPTATPLSDSDSGRTANPVTTAEPLSGSDGPEVIPPILPYLAAAEAAAEEGAACLDLDMAAVVVCTEVDSGHLVTVISGSGLLEGSGSRPDPLGLGVLVAAYSDPVVVQEITITVT